MVVVEVVVAESIRQSGWKKVRSVSVRQLASLGREREQRRARACGGGGHLLVEFVVARVAVPRLVGGGEPWIVRRRL